MAVYTEGMAVGTGIDLTPYDANLQAFVFALTFVAVTGQVKFLSLLGVGV